MKSTSIHYDVRSISIGNFFGYIYSIMFFCLIVVSSVATGIGYLLFNLLKSNYLILNSGLLFCSVIIASICSLVTKYFLQSGIQSNSVTKSFVLFVLSSCFTGMTLTPFVLIGLIFGFHLIIYSFGLCLIFFLLLSFFALSSSKSFTPLKNVLLTGSILLLILGFVKMILYLFNPQLADKIDLFESIIGISISTGFILYRTSELRELYNEFSHFESNRTLMNLGIVGASLLLDTFVMLFVYIAKFMFRVHKDKD